MKKLTFEEMPHKIRTHGVNRSPRVSELDDEDADAEKINALVSAVWSPPLWSCERLKCCV